MALSMLVEKETKILIAERSRDKPLNYVNALKTDTGNPSLWQQYEGLSPTERILIQLLSKYN